MAREEVPRTDTGAGEWDVSKGLSRLPQPAALLEELPSQTAHR